MKGESMQIAVVSGPGEVELRDAQRPSCGPGQLLVELAGCGLCTFDRRLFSGETPIYPTAAGHEPAGRVIEVGAEVADLPGTPQLGQLVTLDMRTRCGTCSACRRGRSAICLASQSHDRSDGLISIAGGLAEVIAVDPDHAWPVGDVPTDHAVMGEPIACVAHSMRRGGFCAGDSVAVVGGGFMGRLHLAMARAAGAAKVGVIEVSAQRREEATAAGATWIAAPEQARDIGGYNDVVFVTAGAPGALELALDLLAKGGSAVLYGAFPKDLSVGVGPNHMHHEETSIIGVHSHEPEDWRTAAGLIASGALRADLDALVTARFSLGRAVEGFRLADSEPVYRVIVGGA
jgi:2-desacetyl-2-hydroxyethyl bacteriochlorophyllide A dehydrogenase